MLRTCAEPVVGCGEDFIYDEGRLHGTHRNSDVVRVSRDTGNLSEMCHGSQRRPKRVVSCRVVCRECPVLAPKLPAFPIPNSILLRMRLPSSLSFISPYSASLLRRPDCTTSR